MKSKLLKRIGTVFMALAVAMTMGASTAVFAAATPDSDIFVTGITEKVDSVTAYKIVKEVNGAWVTENNVTIKDIEHPTAAEITAIAKNVSGLTAKPMDKQTDGSYKATVDPGMYLVLVKGGKKVYNPMIVSADYVENGNTVSAASSFTNNAYAKSSDPTIDKEIVEPTGNGNSKGSSTEVGSVVNFKITVVVPSYSDEYVDAKVEIKDTLDQGLTLGTVNVTGAPDGTAAVKDGNSFTVTITELAWLKAHGGETITVEYSAKVNENAKYNFNPNNNKAELFYSNNPTDSSEGEKKTTETHTYTFGLDANLGGTQTTQNQKTHELIKIDENGEAHVVDETKTFTDITSDVALTDAKFSLTSAATGKEFTATSGSDGALSFTGLAEGEYTLKETKAPTGYQLSDKEYKVVISASYNTDGTLASYTITIDGTVVSKFTATYEGNVITNIEPTTQGFVEVKNTKTPGLPSTGGIGTYIFTIVGVAIMAMAALMFRRRNKSAKDAQ